MRQLIFPLLFVLAACNSNEENRIYSESESEQIGRRVFNENCTSCHGYDGELCANGSPDLTKTEFSLEEVKEQVLNGKNTMPSFRDLLSAEEVDSVASYVISFSNY